MIQNYTNTGMSNKKALDAIDKKIAEIKNNSEYKRLLGSHRGLRDDNKFKGINGQLKKLITERELIAKPADNKYSRNGRITSLAILKPGSFGPKSEVGTIPEHKVEFTVRTPEPEVKHNSRTITGKQRMVRPVVQISQPKLTKPSAKDNKKRLKPKVPIYARQASEVVKNPVLSKLDDSDDEDDLSLEE